MKKVLIFGGTGFVGNSLSQHLQDRGFIPIQIGRNAPSSSPFQFHKWDALTVGSWVKLLESAHAVVNLAGKTVDCIKTKENRDLILRSRVDSTLTIGKAYEVAKTYPKVWIQMSTAHIYGDPPTEVCTESSAYGEGLAPMVGQAWEEAFYESKPEDVRGFVLRTSFVIGKNGGALSSLKRLAKLGLGGKVASGSQGISWIHEYDHNEIIHQAIINDHYDGMVVASSPHPVSNQAFMKAIRQEMKIPIGLPSPEWMTRLGATYIFRTDPELVLYGRYVKSERLEKLGFKFKYSFLKEALHDLL